MFKKIAIFITTYLGLVSVTLAEPMTISCEYPYSFAANFTPNPDTNDYSVTTDFKEDQDLTFKLIVDHTVSTDTGYMIGSMGTSKVDIVWGETKTTFIEKTANGTIHTTAIYGLEVGKSPSVHSRNFGGKGYEMPSQNYGTCTLE